MSLKKWVMKQYWRIGTVRALLSLALGMFVLGRYYYSYIPWLRSQGLIGALILGSFLFLLFLGIGWIYDVKAKMWSPNRQATVERDPYRYVPNPRELTIDYPITYTILSILYDIFDKLGLDVSHIRDAIEYQGEYLGGKISRDDLMEAKPRAIKYMEFHGFNGSESQDDSIPFSSRIKLGFEIQNLRLGWIQALTGLAQDVLVFGALYVSIFYPIGNVPAEAIYQGILFLSIPMFVFFIAFGWYYDMRLKVWSADSVVKIERNPYTFIPDPRMYSIMFPMYYTIFSSFKQIFEKENIPTKDLDKIIEYLDSVYSFDISRDEDLDAAKLLPSKYDELFKLPNKE